MKIGKILTKFFLLLVWAFVAFCRYQIFIISIRQVQGTSKKNSTVITYITKRILSYLKEYGPSQNCVACVISISFSDRKQLFTVTTKVPRSTIFTYKWSWSVYFFLYLLVNFKQNINEKKQLTLFNFIVIDYYYLRYGCSHVRNIIYLIGILIASFLLTGY